MRWFYDLRIRTKLLLAFTVVSAVTAFVGFMGLNHMGRVNSLADDLYERDLLGVSHVKEANVYLINMGRAEKNFLLSATDQERAQHRANIYRFGDLVEEEMQNARPLFHTEQGKQLLEKYDRAWEERKNVADQIVTLGMSDAHQQSRESVALSMGIGRDVSDVVENLITELSRLKEENAKGAAEETAATYKKSRVFKLLVFAGVLFGLGLGFFISNIIGKPVRMMALAADRIAAGDVDQNIDYEAKDEIGILANSFRTVISALRSLMIDDGGAALRAAANKDLTARVKIDYQGVYGEMKDNINSLLEAMEEGMSQVAEGATKVRSSSQEIATSSQDVGKTSQSIAETISQVAAGSTEQSKIVATSAASMEQLGQAIEEVSKGAQSQAQTVEETVSLVQQITAAIESVAKTAQQAAGSSLEVSEVAKSGGENVDKSVHGMARIKEATGNVAGAIGQLGENSKQIGAIVETIDDIADQTNLLALNAAIEAARAGEHGKGFAVVADEVRKLAERSSKATKEIADLIGQIHSMTDHAVKAMEEGQSEVEAGTELANEAGEALSAIQEAVNGVVRQIEEMSAATQQMSASSSEVVRAVESVSAITEQSTAATEEMAASSTEVTKSVEQVAAVSEQNAASAEEVSAAAEEQNASVEEMSASAEEMARIAEELQTLVNQFKIGEGGSGSDVRIANAKPTSQTIRKAA